MSLTIIATPGKVHVIGDSGPMGSFQALGLRHELDRFTAVAAITLQPEPAPQPTPEPSATPEPTETANRSPEQRRPYIGPASSVPRP